MPVGRVVKAHGIRGEIRIHPHDAEGLGILGADALVLGDSRGTETFRVRAARPRGRLVIVSLEGVADRDRAEALVGREVHQLREAMPPLGPGEYYWFQLEGLRVWTTRGRYLGVLRRFLDTGAHDVYVVDGPQGEVLIPAVPEVVTEVDLEGRRILVDPPPGLVETDAV